MMATLALPGAVLGGAGVIAGFVGVHRSRTAGSLHLGLERHLPGKRNGDVIDEDQSQRKNSSRSVYRMDEQRR